MKVDQLNHVALEVVDVDASCAFYEAVLGLEKIQRPDFGFPGAWYALGSGQALHLISGREETVVGGRRGTHFALRADSVAAAEERLKAQQVDYTPPRQRPDGVTQIYLEDPDGHTIELSFFDEDRD